MAYRIDKSQGLELVAVPCPVEGAVNLGMGVRSSGSVVEVVVELCKVMDPPVILQAREIILDKISTSLGETAPFIAQLTLQQ